MSQKIIKCEISKMPASFLDPMPQVTVTFEDNSTKMLFEYYPDEISFSAHEFIGLTEEQASRLKYTKDLNYLRS